MNERLYTKDILRLAASMSPVGLVETADHIIRKTSRICGSRLTISASLDAVGGITDFGQEVKACALGQASASLMARHVDGLTRDRFALLNTAFRQLVATGCADLPKGYEDFALFAPVAEHKSRLGSVLLPFDCLADLYGL